MLIERLSLSLPIYSMSMMLGFDGFCLVLYIPDSCCISSAGSGYWIIQGVYDLSFFNTRVVVGMCKMKMGLK